MSKTSTQNKINQLGPITFRKGLETGYSREPKGYLFKSIKDDYAAGDVEDFAYNSYHPKRPRYLLGEWRYEF